MPEEINGKTSIRIPILVGAILVGVYGVYGVRVPLSYIKVYKHEIFKKRESEKFVNIIIECEQKVQDENTLGGEFLLSEEERQNLVEECANQNNKNERFHLRYPEEF